MNENKLKELYNDEIASSAPDMDALWNRIEAGLSEKNKEENKGADNAAVKAKRKPFITLQKGFALAAACVLLAIILPTAKIANTKSVTDNGANMNADTVRKNDKAPSYEMADNAASEDVPEIPTDIPSYSDLMLSPAERSGISFTGEPNGGEYFNEETVLLETDCFVDARVTEVYGSADGSCVYYTLEASSVYSMEGEESGVTLTVSSCSPYEMLVGREYLIPLKETEKGLETVFDSVPQIEFTEDGGMVFYNGWKTLSDVRARDILYPQSGVDDFFYDRMKFSYSGYKRLIDKWRG